jgi:hypothetical protein
MKSYLSVLAMSALLLSGCSNDLQEKLKLIEYQNCLDVQGTSYQDAVNQGYGVDNNKDGLTDNAADYAQFNCVQYRP